MDHNNMMSLAWHTAVLTRTKKMPGLKDLLVDGKPKRRNVQSWEQQYSIASAWVSRKKK